ncbi:hypothetical protein J6590_017078 [Homalodisca vitripennis]|nr:hypothetical protein J6590_017078 [Homalodisca vitripennis]
MNRCSEAAPGSVRLPTSHTHIAQSPRPGHVSVLRYGRRRPRWWPRPAPLDLTSMSTTRPLSNYGKYNPLCLHFVIPLDIYLRISCKTFSTNTYKTSRGVARRE